VDRWERRKHAGSHCTEFDVIVLDLRARSRSLDAVENDYEKENDSIAIPWLRLPQELLGVNR
jgi:hypothetical protein